MDLRFVIVRATLLALVVTAGGEQQAASGADRGSRAPATSSRVAGSGSPASRRPGSAEAKRAPSSPPLTSGEGVPAGGDGASSGESSPQGEVDPLVSNGLRSPLCDGSLDSSGLSVASRRDCETSGFVAARAPTDDYGVDVHIDTGVLGLSSGGLLTTVQELFVTPVWMALVWVVHALVVMLEWCFAIDLLDNASIGGGVARGLRQMQQALTSPWLASVLAIAAVLAAYNGLVRRRVAETVGQALLAVAMIIGGMWVIVDPTGTVGALGGWANEAGLGTLAVTTTGTPARAGRALADSMGDVFATAIEVPWCYLEFGDVGWCRNPARIDPPLRAAAQRIATGELGLVGCKLNTPSLSICVARGSTQAKALEHSAALLRDAPSNGAIFLALPANGSARNSINDKDSLLRAICQSADATRCRGPAAAEAEFRTNGGTWARVGGLLLIAAGVLGMILLLGFIALRLLAAALFSLLYLMLAPAAVLAPALGESGRAVFRKWAAQLLGAVVSKLLFSFLLGVILAILAILAGLEALGWWTQWLLMSAFWWGAFARRHQILDTAGGTLSREHVSRQRSVVKSVSDVLDSPRRALDSARAVRQRLSRPPPDPDRPQKLVRARMEPARASIDEQSTRTLAHDFREARAHADAIPEIRRRMSVKQAQLARVKAERSDALAGGDSRRAAELSSRGRRIEREIAREQHDLGLGAAAARVRPRAGGSFAAEQTRVRAGFLDAQAALPASARARARGQGVSERRDYAALAGLAGLGRKEYEQLEPGARRAARLKIDRELALRSEMGAAAIRGGRPDGGVEAGGREGQSANPELDGFPHGRTREARPTTARAGAARSGLDAWRQEGLLERAKPAGDSSESSVMRDIREVASGRKRHLGTDRR